MKDVHDQNTAGGCRSGRVRTDRSQRVANKPSQAARGSHPGESRNGQSSAGMIRRTPPIVTVPAGSLMWRESMGGGVTGPRWTEGGRSPGPFGTITHEATFMTRRRRMPTDVARTLREALAKLGAERRHLDRKILALQGALRAVNGTPAAGRRAGGRPKRARRSMSPAARRAVSRRMKAYWAKRRARTRKGTSANG